MKQYDRSREYIDLAIKIADDNKYKFRGDIAKDNGELLFIECKYDLAEAEMNRSVDYYVEKKLLGEAVAVYANLGMMNVILGENDIYAFI